MTPSPLILEPEASRPLLILGDCQDWLPRMAAHSIDHAIFDAQYDKEAHTEGRRLCAGSFKARAAGKDTTIIKPISYPPMTEEERTFVGGQVARVTRRWILAFCQVESAMKWRRAFEAGGAEYVRTGCWQKTDAQPQLSGDRPGQGWEAVVICHGKRAAGGAKADLPLLKGLERQHAGRMEWNGGGHCAIWRGPTRDHGGKLKTRKLVDGQKPLWLLEKIVDDYTDEGDLVADFYLGGGTTGIACRKLGRRFVGFEKLPEHHTKARQRFADEFGEPSIKVYTDKPGQMGLAL